MPDKSENNPSICKDNDTRDISFIISDFDVGILWLEKCIHKLEAFKTNTVTAEKHKELNIKLYLLTERLGRLVKQPFI